MKEIIDIDFTYQAEVLLPRKRKSDTFYVSGVLPYQVNIQNVFEDDVKPYIAIEELQKNFKNHTDVLKEKKIINFDNDFYEEVSYSVEDILSKIKIQYELNNFFGIKKNYFIKSEELPDYKEYIEDNREYIENDIKNSLDNFFSSHIMVNNQFFIKKDPLFISFNINDGSWKKSLSLNLKEKEKYENDTFVFPLYMMDAIQYLFENYPIIYENDIDFKYIFSNKISKIRFEGDIQDYEQDIPVLNLENTQKIINKFPFPNKDWDFEKMSSKLILLYGSELLPCIKMVENWKTEDYTRDNVDYFINVVKNFQNAYRKEFKTEYSDNPMLCQKIQNMINTYESYYQAVDYCLEKINNNDIINVIDNHNEENYFQKVEKNDTSLKLTF